MRIPQRLLPVSGPAAGRIEKFTEHLNYCKGQTATLISGLTVFEIPFCKSGRYFY